MNTKNKTMIKLLLIFMVGVAAVEAAGYNPVVHQAQTLLAASGFNPDVLDGVYGPNTAKAISTYQSSKGLTASGQLDSATLDSLGIGVSVDLANNVADWRAVPNQTEIDQMVAAVNSTSNPYADYRPNAPGAALDLPGKSILDAMNRSADVYGSRLPRQPKSTAQGYKYMWQCLKTGYAPTHWSDITIHYYCQMSKPRTCYTYALSGKSTGGAKYSRPRAYKECVAGQLDGSADFKWVPSDQPLVYQYVMYGQTNTFNHEQEQAIINAFYGIGNPTDKRECNAKRPRRTEDPQDGTHCLVNKVMSQKLIGRSK